MSAPPLARIVATRASVALVVLDGDEPTWLNDAARRLVVPHGGGWDGTESPVAALRRVGAGDRPLALAARRHALVARGLLRAR